jgi:hypothetical protein
VVNRLGNPVSLFPQGNTLSERAQFAMAQGKMGTGGHGGHEDLTEALIAPNPIEGHHGLPAAGHRLTIGTLEEVGSAEVVVRQRVQDDILIDCGEREGTLGSGDGLIMRTHTVEMR